jgi:hypothetical protein
MLLFVAITGLGIALIITYRKLVETEHQLSTYQPLSLSDVARQFQTNASIGPVTVTVDDVRYSGAEKAYKVEFSWIDSVTKQKWSTETRLLSDGFGKYQGAINSAEFEKSAGISGAPFVVVETPSAFR